MRTNTKTPSVTTHEGARASIISPEQELERSVMACMLFEDEFYESGEKISDRIISLVKQVSLKNPSFVLGLAIRAKNDMKLRHVPLHLAVSLFLAGVKGCNLGAVISHLIQRPDEIPEILALLWKYAPKARVPKQFRRGLASAFNKFSEYQFAKYDRDNAVKLRDALFLSHAKPKDEEQARIFKAIVDRTLKTPDTWEVELSGGKDKKETFERLMTEKKLGGLAFLRNLRNMQQSGVNESLIRGYFEAANFERVLPFRFIAAANHAPLLEAELEQAMFKCLAGMPKLRGKTILLVDNSGSMYGTKISAKSDLDRSDAACALAILLKEICEDSVILGFSQEAVVVPNRRGFALKDSIQRSTAHGGTDIREAVHSASMYKHDRIIVITDEQSQTSVSDPLGLGYFINVASYEHGIGYGKWTNITGFSEAIVSYIQAKERSDHDNSEIDQGMADARNGKVSDTKTLVKDLDL